LLHLFCGAKSLLLQYQMCVLYLPLIIGGLWISSEMVYGKERTTARTNVTRCQFVHRKSHIEYLTTEQGLLQ
jgi:hypothetical protein